MKPRGLTGDELGGSPGGAAWLGRDGGAAGADTSDCGGGGALHVTSAIGGRQKFGVCGDCGGGLALNVTSGSGGGRYFGLCSNGGGGGGLTAAAIQKVGAADD